MIRPATIKDADAVVGLGVESVSRDPLPLVIDKKAMREMFMSLVGRANQFAWVAERDGAVVASVAACCQPIFWARGQQVSVLLFYSREKGAGLPLIRKLVEWIKSRPAIKLAVFELEPQADPRIAKALRRLGFARESQNVTYVRGASK